MVGVRRPPRLRHRWRADPDPHRERARPLRERPDHGGAEDVERGEAVDLDPNSLDALFLWFDVVSAIGGVGQAIAELETVTGSRADAWGPPFVLGIRTGQGGYEKVREYLATAFERSQNEHTTPAYLELLIRRGDLKAGLDAATRASETPGADSLGETGWYWIAMAFRLCNLPDRARWALGKAGLGVFPDWDQDVVRTYRGL